MSKLKTALIIVTVVIGVLVVLAFVADYFLKDLLGVGLLDLFSVVAESGATMESADSFETIMPAEIGEETFNTLTEEKATMDETFNGVKTQIDEIVNNNEELTTALRENLGEKYTIYLFSVYTIGELTFKVFEWSVEITDGYITTFEAGETEDTYNVLIQIDQSIASSLLSGNADQETITEWVTGQMIKINPITEVAKVVTILPAIMSAIPS